MKKLINKTKIVGLDQEKLNRFVRYSFVFTGNKERHPNALDEEWIKIINDEYSRITS